MPSVNRGGRCGSRTAHYMRPRPRALTPFVKHRFMNGNKSTLRLSAAINQDRAGSVHDDESLSVNRQHPSQSSSQAENLAAPKKRGEIWTFYGNVLQISRDDQTRQEPEVGFQKSQIEAVSAGASTLAAAFNPPAALRRDRAGAREVKMFSARIFISWSSEGGGERPLAEFSTVFPERSGEAA